MQPAARDSFHSKEVRKSCKYILARQPCPFGARCWYQHTLVSESSSHPVELSSDLGKSHSTGAIVLDFASFPTLKNNTSAAAIVIPSAAPSSNISTVDERDQSRPVRERGGPPKLTLEAFFKRANSLQPRQAVVRPFPRQSNEELREVELQLMKARFPGNQCQLVEKGRDKDVYRLKWSPMDPQWKLSRTVDLLVIFPASYPTIPFSVDVPGDQALLPPAIACVKSAIHQYLVQLVHKEGGSGLLLRPFLRWLDNNICAVVAPQVEQCATNSIQPAPDPLQTTSDFSCDAENNPDYNTLLPNDPDEEHKSFTVQNPIPVKRGTEIRFQELKLSSTIGVVIFERLKLIVRCNRCRDVISTGLLKAEITSCIRCARCQTACTILYHPAVLHTANATCGFLDLESCIAFDVVLQDSIATITCLECGKSITHTGMSFGEQRDSWCQRCHAKLSLLSNQCHLVQHQPADTAPTAAIEPLATLKKATTKKDPAIQPGRPLPKFGTCEHYKKSCRWLRFPCCGKVYPCDVCHDSSEDHPMERAKRMLCGYCATEQPYTISGLCAKCGSDLTNIRSSGFWEGGHGCRSQVKMNRNDRHKYSNIAKTASKKQERLSQSK